MKRSFVPMVPVLAVFLSLPSIRQARADQAAQRGLTPQTPASQASQAESSVGSQDKIPYSKLTPDQQDIIDRGEVSDGSYIAGGVVGTIIGLGIGEAIQGRYMPTGLIITVGEAAFASLYIDALVDCAATAIGNGIGDSFGGTPTTTNCSLGTAGTIGLVGLVGFRIWEIVDVWATPPSINERYRRLKQHVSGAPELTSSFGVIPALASSDAVADRIDGAALAYQIRF